MALPPDRVIDEPWLVPSTRIVSEPVGVATMAVDDATVMVITSLAPTVGLDEAAVSVVVELERADAAVVCQSVRI